MLTYANTQHSKLREGTYVKIHFIVFVWVLYWWIIRCKLMINDVSVG